VTSTGTSLLRLEDPPLLRGEGRFLDDAPGALHAAFVRSPFAHARVTGIDATLAVEAPGVRLVLTADDLSGLVAAPREREDRRVPARPALHGDVVRMAGDPVAAVVAETPQQAADAASLVFVEYDPLPVVADPLSALDAAPIHPQYEDNVAYDRGSGSREDVAALDASIHLEGVVHHPRLVPVPLEPRTVRATWAGESVTVEWGTQGPKMMRRQVARSFGLDEEQVRVVTPDIGGAFGCKFDFAEEEAVVIEAARRLEAPVQWVEGRREHMSSIGHGRAQRHEYLVAADEDGRILGLWVDSLVDTGARKRWISGPPYTPRMGVGMYDIPLYAWRQRGVFTNRAPTGIYRGAGRPEATLTIERVIDRLADELEIDPVDVRRRNFVRAFPHDNGAGATYDSGDYAAALDTLLDLAGYAGLRAGRDAAQDEGRLVGLGLGAYVEAAAFENAEDASACLMADGTVEIGVGTLDHGQGHRTSFAQLAADRLGVHPSMVRIVQGDTDRVPFGYGTSGSRSLAEGGSAVALAAEALAGRIDALRAWHAERGGEDLGWEDLASSSWEGDRPPGLAPGLAATEHFESGGLVFPFGIHLAQVEVDRETGEVSLLGVWAVDDCGPIVNPMLVYGQRHGGMAQGIGQALWERVVYDANGNLVTGTLADYLMPTAAQMPAVSLGETVTPSPHNPLGAKGVGEAGTIGVVPAIVNGVIDALESFGVEHLDVPLRAETVWRAMQ
jgi:carbon-monoxide dehydrogenase large subunit